MLQNIYVSRTIEIACSQAQALPFIWDIKNIEYCEVKADKVEVTKMTSDTGTYKVKGHFGAKAGLYEGIPWQRTFAYQLHSKGFHSIEAQQPPSAFDIQGGFEVYPLDDSHCKVRHYEQYRLPFMFLPLKPIITMYLKWSQRKELDDLQELIMSQLVIPIKI